jgi:hypothetical protein
MPCRVIPAVKTVKMGGLKGTFIELQVYNGL